MTPGATGKTTNQTLTIRMTDDLVHLKVLLHTLQLRHHWVRLPTGLPRGTAMHQIQKNPSQSLHTNQETLTLKR